MVQTTWVPKGLLLFLILTIVSGQPQDDFSDLLPGPYCSQNNCCPGREDDCAIPILGFYSNITPDGIFWSYFNIILCVLVKVRIAIAIAFAKTQEWTIVVRITGRSAWILIRQQLHLHDWNNILANSKAAIMD